ncbi:MerR HTH family regulatory protein [Halomonas cupida]|uniref:MerR HTH family regulatory protein n=2 Tax=Halomonas cupida TaxID=44933 RepID=A0A1M7I2I7_9GAMM|nr:MerR HTH family regulatory protein [Halomonas cupida]
MSRMRLSSLQLQVNLKSSAMLDISELARQSGIAASKIRYYEEVGLIRSVGRKGLRRVFEPEVVSRLSLIALGQVAGFSLAEIREMLGSDRHPDIDREQLGAKADFLDHRIKELSALRDGLRHAMNCTAPSHLECPTFQRLMRIALTRQAGRGSQLKKVSARRK